MISQGSLAAIVFALVVLCCILGFGIGRAEIVTDCEKLGTFRVSDKVFKCQRVDLK
jgi:hypothetical protein